MGWDYSFRALYSLGSPQKRFQKDGLFAVSRTALRLTAIQIHNTFENEVYRLISEFFRDIYRYRELIWALAQKELRVRYKRSILGFLWALLNPALMMLVLTLVFGTIMRFSIDHYAVFLLSMLLPWTFFSQSLAYSVESIVGNGELLKKVKVARLVFPVASVISNIINFLLSLLPLMLLIVFMRFPLHWTWVYLPVPMLGLFLFTLGASFLFATVNVFYRDVSHIVQIILQAWFYFSPIIYSLDFVPAKYHWIFRLNPLLYVLNGFRLGIYYGIMPSMGSIVLSMACGLASLAVGFAIFRRYQNSFVYYV